MELKFCTMVYGMYCTPQGYMGYMGYIGYIGCKMGYISLPQQACMQRMHSVLCRRSIAGPLDPPGFMEGKQKSHDVRQ